MAYAPCSWTMHRLSGTAIRVDVLFCTYHVTQEQRMGDVTFTLRVDEALKTEFAAAAKACDRTAAQLLRDFMRAYVQQQAQATAPADEVEATAIHSTIGAHIAKNQ